MNKLIEQFEEETELPATWNTGGMGGFTLEYVKWLEKRIEALSIAGVVESVCDCEKYLSLFPNGQYRCTKCWEWWYR